MMDATTHETTTGATPPPSLGRLARDVWRDFWRAFRPLVVFEAVFKAAAFLLGAVGTGWVIGPLIASTGHAAVTNTEIARFLLSPAGIAYLVLIALSLMVATLIEHVGVIAIAAAHLRGQGLTVTGYARRPGGGVRLKLRVVRDLQPGDAGVPLRPFVVLGGLAYLALLSRHDINFYLSNRPPSFYAARRDRRGAAGGPGGVAGGPVRRPRPGHADRAVRGPARPRGDAGEPRAGQGGPAADRGDPAELAARRVAPGRRHGLGIQPVCGLLLETAEVRRIVLVPLVATLLACQALLVSAVSFLLVAVHCLLILRFYLERGGSPDPLLATRPAAWVERVGRGISPARWRFLRLRWLIVLALLGFVGYLGWASRAGCRPGADRRRRPSGLRAAGAREHAERLQGGDRGRGRLRRARRAGDRPTASSSCSTTAT